MHFGLWLFPYFNGPGCHNTTAKDTTTIRLLRTWTRLHWIPDHADYGLWWTGCLYWAVVRCNFWLLLTHLSQKRCCCWWTPLCFDDWVNWDVWAALSADINQVLTQTSQLVDSMPWCMSNLLIVFIDMRCAWVVVPTLRSLDLGHSPHNDDVDRDEAVVPDNVYFWWNCLADWTDVFGGWFGPKVLKCFGKVVISFSVVVDVSGEAVCQLKDILNQLLKGLLRTWKLWVVSAEITINPHPQCAVCCKSQHWVVDSKVSEFLYGVLICIQEIVKMCLTYMKFV